MKRNKRTEKICDQNLSPLTEKILAMMGSGGGGNSPALAAFLPQPGPNRLRRGVEEAYSRRKAETEPELVLVVGAVLEVWVFEPPSLDFGATSGDSKLADGLVSAI